MASRIITKKGSGAPLASDLVHGELAVDTVNKRLYTENAGGTIIELGTAPSTIDINAGTIDGTVIGGSSAAAGSFTTISASGEIAANGGVAFGDNDKATFGAGSDLQIYHDGSNSFISDQGSGNLTLLGGNFRLRDTTNVTDSILANPANYVKLYYAGDEKLSTVSDGIDVNGEITADALTINSSGVQIGTILQSTSTVSSRLALMDANTTSGSQVGIGATGNTLGLYAAGGTPKVVVSATGIDVTGTVTADGLTVDGAIVGQSATGYATATLKADTSNTGSGGTPELRFELGGTQKARLRVDTSDNVEIATGTGSGSTRFGVASNGDISFYEDTGTTAKFFWDASAESLGIGIASPNRLLHIHSASGFTNGRIHFSNPTTGTATSDGFFIGQDGGDGNVSLWNFENNYLRFATNNAERMRIDSSGNLLVGTTSTDLHTTSTGTGVRIGDRYLHIARNSNPAAIFNRITSDGDIVQFRKDGTTVGSISVTASTTAYNITSDERLKENIVDTTHTVDINDIKVRQYDWKSNGEHQRYGFIAQELEAVYPEAVFSPEDPEEMKAVDYSKLVPLLVKEIQDLKAEVAALKGA